MWQYANSIAALSRGSNQPFYSVLAEDSTLRYASEENVELLTEVQEHDFLRLVKVDRRVCNLSKRFDGWDPYSARFLLSATWKTVFPDD
ncbi:hypothetical protein BT69DRAFT_21345 [Atractiella rhizophila]|nr:hypothetical protein BT69DRAFT_21345 [Atractiella rhizophila]